MFFFLNKNEDNVRTNHYKLTQIHNSKQITLFQFF